ncbi:MAG: DUF2779 domain-containing protein [Candidatus Eisenbacteria bacterium]
MEWAPNPYLFHPIPAAERRMHSHTLTKRDILQAIECPRLACLSLRDRALGRERTETDAGTRIQLAHGNMVGAESRGEFPGGFAVDGAGFTDSLRLTEECIGRGERVLFEAAFALGPVRARTDILLREGDRSWALWEVKAGAEPKEEYLVDIAVQIHVLEGLGMSVRAGLMLVDREATRLSPTLFRRLDCDGEARLRLPLVREVIDGLAAFAGGGETPEGVLGRRCRDCARRAECWPRLPRRSVLDLYQGHGGWRVVEDLLARGVTDIARIPEDVPLTEIQRRQVEAALTGSPVVVGDPAAYVARELVFPLHFLDFEAARPPVPEFPGQHPYDLIPFQWSCHVQDEPEAPLDHHEFLSNRPGDPRRPMTEALLETIRPEGSILVYSSFEQEVLRNMAVVFPELASPLEALEGRLVDLLPVVRDHVYHPDFDGSFSIKNVLPVLAQGLGYGGMGVSDGMEAVWAYHLLTTEDLGDGERDRISRDLLEYCRQDSLAMYEVYRALASGGP